MMLTRPRYRYICPHCRFRLPRKHFYDSGTRPCDACGRPITPGDNTLMTWIVSIGLVLLIAITILLYVAGLELFILGLVAIALLMLGLHYAAPYLADFNSVAADPSNRCPRCGYDIRATPAQCPECGLDVPPELQPTSDAPPAKRQVP